MNYLLSFPSHNYENENKMVQQVYFRNNACMVCILPKKFKSQFMNG